MKKQLTKLAFAAALGLAITLTACEEKEAAKAGGGTFTDSRDGKEYKTVKIGEQVWMAENLNFAAEDSKCYEDNASNCDKYGRLYNWEMAKEVCPNGWHLPSDAEWQTLVDFAGGGEIAKKKLKAKNGWENFERKPDNGTDDYGFSALSGGGMFYVFTDDDYRYDFDGAGLYGYWWTATKKNSHSFINCYFDGVGMDEGKDEDGNGGDISRYFHSVRCIQN